MPAAIENRQNLFHLNLRRIRRSTTILLKELECSDKEVGLLLVDDNQIQKINSEYLHRNSPTNVISFSMTEGEFGNINPQLLGDIVISVETASRDASKSQIDLLDELDFLIIHGLLHLLGYNHESVSAERAGEMNTRQRELFFLLRNYQIE
jgi:probable rRNA maturation factor